MLCGVEVDHARGLAGHSDADVAVHALIDALLGAAGMGDIGRLFPDTDPAYKDASSIELLATVAAGVAEAGWCIENVDVTVVCERPKLSEHRDDMRRWLGRGARHRRRRRERQGDDH